MAIQEISGSISKGRKVTVKDDDGNVVQNPDGSDKKVPHPHAGTTMSVKYDLGDDLEGLISLCQTGGKSREEAEKIVFSNAAASIVIDIQAAIRRLIEKGSTSDEAQSWADKYVPGVSTGRSKKSDEQRLRESAEKLNADQLEKQIAFLESLKAQRMSDAEDDFDGDDGEEAEEEYEEEEV